MDFIDIPEWNRKIEKAFQEAKSRLPEYQNELKVLSQVLTMAGELQDDEKSHLQSRVKELETVIADLFNDTSFGFYLLEAQEYLDKYLQTLPQQQKGISFMKKDRVFSDETQQLSQTFLHLVEKYNKILQLPLPKLQSGKKMLVCECGSKDLEMIDDRAYTCGKCGLQVKEQVGVLPTFKDIDRVNASGKYKYSRIIHIQNCMRQYQGKQKAKIPPAVIQDVREQLRLLGIKKVTPAHIRTALQNSGRSDQYENFILIWSLVTNQSCPDISEYEDRLIRDFELVEREYNSLMDNPGEERSSFMSYPYVLYQLLRKNSIPTDLSYFNMLQGERIEWCDEVMEKIFDRLGWSGVVRLG